MMLQVLAALVPAALAHVWYFGPGFIFNLLVAGIFAIAGEAFVMWLRGRPAGQCFMTDNSYIINDLMDGNAYYGKQAIKSTFEKEAAAYRIVHLATQ